MTEERPTNRMSNYTLLDSEYSAKNIRWNYDLYEEIMLFDELWMKGFSIWEIGEIIGIEDEDNLRLLEIDRRKRGRIKPRKWGIYGDCETFLKKTAESIKDFSKWW